VSGAFDLAGLSKGKKTMSSGPSNQNKLVPAEKKMEPRAKAEAHRGLGRENGVDERKARNEKGPALPT